MRLQDLSKGVEGNLKIFSGQPVIKGIPIYLILELLSAGYDFEKIIKAYPTLTEEDVKVAIYYAAKIMKNEKGYEFAVS